MIVFAVIFVILVVVMLGFQFREGLEDFRGMADPKEQRIWERSHLSNKGYAKRRRQLIRQMVIFALISLAVWAATCYAGVTFWTENQKDYFEADQDKMENAFMGAVFLTMMAIAFTARLPVLSAKLKALRALNESND